MAYPISTDAALTGFRVIRERPRVLALWGLIQLVITILTATMTATLGGAALSKLQGMAFRTDADPTAMLGLARQLAPLYGLGLLMALVFYPAVYAAMNRAVLRPEDERFAYFRIGADELRQLGLMLLMIVVGIGGYIALVLGLVLVGAVVGMLAATLKGAGVLVTGLMGLITLVTLIGGVIYFGVRLSLASPLTFATGKINLFGSWALTRGLFWPMFGTYALAVALSAVATLLGLAVILPLTGILAGGFSALPEALTPHSNTLPELFSPARLLYLTLLAFLRALIWPLMLTPAAALYREIASARGLPGGARPSVENIFS
ncbi:MAG: hypothetical protein P4L64_00990 [Caulobacteraceae bacterium]|nr:hypothetical protein [Caulobacteraceae bacterium]